MMKVERMKTFFKIILIVLAIFPVWLTIVALGAPRLPSNAWKDAMNTKLVEAATEIKRAQIVEFQMTADQFDDAFLAEKFSLEIVDERARGLSTLEARFTDESGRLVRVLRVPAKMKIEEKISVTTRAIPRATPLQYADFKEEWVDSSSISDRPLTAAQLIGKSLKAPARLGTPVYSTQLEKSNLIQIGDRVRIIVNSNGLAVTGLGIAKEAGQRGQTIRVVNPESKKEIYGVITDDKQIEVRI